MKQMKNKCKKIKNNSIRLIGILVATLMIVSSVVYFSTVSNRAMDGNEIRMEVTNP